MSGMRDSFKRAKGLRFGARLARYAAGLLAAILAAGGAAHAEENANQAYKDALKDLNPNSVYAVFHTSMGEIICELYPEYAPKTVANFIGLAKGTKEWTNPKTKKKMSGPLYDGTIFHRVIPGFMIQGGDPLGTGSGGPGYTFEDEFQRNLKFDQPGRLAMANRGPNTNGSQFFITHVPTPHLDGKHTIFGQVVFGQDLVDAIGAVPANNSNRPRKDVNLISVEILNDGENEKATKQEEKNKGEKSDMTELDPSKTWATFHTSVGDIVCELFPEQAPKTVANFIGLATGAKEWTDPAAHEKTNRPLYNGSIFHRIIPDFMIQGGDPLGRGTGGPGYQFEDEFDDSLKFDKPGRLAMANAGPNTNGSQFFITHVPTPWLNNHHTIFGQVVSGQDVVDAMADVERDGMDKPIDDIVLIEVAISQPK